MHRIALRHTRPLIKTNLRRSSRGLCSSRLGYSQGIVLLDYSRQSTLSEPSITPT